MTDYITLAEFKSYAKIVSVDGIDDAVISALISGASLYIDKFTGRRFSSNTETHLFDVPTGRDRNILFLDDDLLSITTLTNGDSTVITSGYYNLLPLNKSPKYAIRLKDSSSYAWEPTSSGDYVGAISVAGAWGYAATAPADIKTACYEISMAAYKRRSTIGSNQAPSVMTPAGLIIQPEDVSKQVVQILRGYIRAF